METDSVASALEREHQEVDAAIEAFTGGPQDDQGRADLSRALSVLRRHIYIEEEFLFPALREAGLDGPVMVMLREHAEIWKLLDTIEPELTSIGDAAHWAGGATLCRELDFLLREHNLKEERVLYPLADRVLTVEVISRVGSVLDSGSLPQGWLCQGG
jgi:regulator of cell morphogenesis and NO signaling